MPSAFKGSIALRSIASCSIVLRSIASRSIAQMPSVFKVKSGYVLYVPIVVNSSNYKIQL